MKASVICTDCGVYISARDVQSSKLALCPACLEALLTDTEETAPPVHPVAESDRPLPTKPPGDRADEGKVEDPNVSEGQPASEYGASVPDTDAHHFSTENDSWQSLNELVVLI
jgi:hypothetical protein